jgi:hypothetical protein
MNFPAAAVLRINPGEPDSLASPGLLLNLIRNSAAALPFLQLVDEH